MIFSTHISYSFLRKRKSDINRLNITRGFLWQLLAHVWAQALTHCLYINEEYERLSAGTDTDSMDFRLRHDSLKGFQKRGEIHIWECFLIFQTEAWKIPRIICIKTRSNIPHTSATIQSPLKKNNQRDNRTLYPDFTVLTWDVISDQERLAEVQSQMLGLLSPWPSLHKKVSWRLVIAPGTTYTANKCLLHTCNTDGLKADLPDLFSSHIRSISIMQVVSFRV